MRGSLIMFYGNKHGGVKIYLVIYLEKIMSVFSLISLQHAVKEV
jgi:hypothetical protein